MSEEKVLETEWDKLNYPNVINKGIARKIVNGKVTNQTCITFYVIKKVSATALKPEEMIPKTIDGVCTDVVELKADYVLGVTGPSKKRYEIQKRLAGGVKPR